MNEQNRKTTLLAGAFVVCGLVLLGGLVLEFGSLRHRMRKPYQLHATFLDAQNLIRNAPVKRAGAVIGRVASDPQLVDGLKGVAVELEIYPEFQIPKGSRFAVVAVGLMGDSMIDVTLPENPTGEFLTSGDQIEGAKGGDLTSAASRLSDEAVILMQDLGKSVRELDKTIRRLDAGAFSDQNFGNFSGALESIRKAAAKIETEVLSKDNEDQLTAGLAGLRRAVDEAEAAIKHGSSAMAKADKAFDELGPTMGSLKDTAAALTKTAASIDAFTNEVRNGDGLLGALINDEKLKSDFKRFMTNLRRDGFLWYDDEAPEEKPAPSRKPQPSSTRRP